MHTVGGPKGVEEVERLFPLPSWIRAKNGRSPFVSQRTPRTGKGRGRETRAQIGLLTPRPKRTISAGFLDNEAD